MEFTMHGIHKLTHNPKANAKAALLAPGHGALKDLEDAGLVCFRNANAVIPDGKSGLCALANQQDLNWLASAVLDRIRDQVVGDLLDNELVERPGYLMFDVHLQAAT
jgi:hypothetical protein